MRASQRDYRRSNAEVRLRFAPGPQARDAAHLFLGLPCDDHRARTAAAQALCAALSRDAGISPLRSVEFVNRPEPHSHDGQRLRYKVQGRYRATREAGRPRGPLNADIKIYNLTAMRQQPRAALGALTTLLHEWLHHYDTEKLRITTIHTSGFYSRLRELRAGLWV